MKQRCNWPARLAAAALVCISLAGVALAAGQQGTQADPLVTKSYVEQVVIPNILTQVDAKLAQREQSLRSQLTAEVERYLGAGGDRLPGGSGGEGTSAGAYRVVTLQAGQTVTGAAACEFLLRSGTAVCVSSSAPGLVDMTAGTTLASGGALVENHLYLATIEGRGVRASTAATLMVRGSYTVS